MELKKTSLIPPTFLIGILGILIISIYNTAFKNKKFTCNKYILNSYLYILLILVIVILEVLLLEYNNITVTDIFGRIDSIFTLLLSFVFVIGLLIITMTINPKNVLLKHTVWLLFALSIGLFLYPSYDRAKKNNVLMEVLFTLVSILVIFSIVAFINPDIISLSMGPILTLTLIGIIIFQFFRYYFNRKNKNYRTPKWLSYVIIILFILFILYDTKLIQINAKNCKEKTVDYINESLGIFLDAINIFQQLVNLKT